MASGTSAPAFGGIALIVVCFIGSAGLRLGDSGPAIAQEIGTMTAGSPGEADKPAAKTEPADALLAAIREREEQLDVRAQDLANRAQALRVAEEKLAEQLDAFEQAQRNLEETLAVADQAAERDIARMTTVYENMKPEDAARIIEQMDVAFAAGLLARMRPEIAAQVMTGMDPGTAYALTLTIASRHSDVPTE